MNPEQIAKTSEHSHQAAFFCWVNQQQDYPHLKFAHAIPNGGLRGKVQAARLKAEGVRAGVPDVFVPYPIHLGTDNARAGLYIEFKKPGIEKRKDGGLSKNQIEWRGYLQSMKYEHMVVYSYKEAIDGVLEYLTK
tara:strand:+ start:931 stop:1335 length:405 start_codon:yes stop_codon:yes gene_type:complete